MIRGVGVDIVHVSRFRAHLDKTPALIDRLFTPPERQLSINSLAARFAAKEALVKALGGSHGFGWQDLGIVKDGGGKPAFALTGNALLHLREESIDTLHLTMSHDGDTAIAFVIAEARS